MFKAGRYSLRMRRRHEVQSNASVCRKDMTRNVGRVIAKSDAEENLRFSPARWLIAAGIFHLAVTCIVYGLGRFAVLSAAFDRNGIAVSFAPDGVLYLRDTIATRGGAPKSLSKRRFVIVNPCAKLKYFMLRRSDPSSRRSNNSSRICRA